MSRRGLVGLGAASVGVGVAAAMAPVATASAAGSPRRVAQPTEALERKLRIRRERSDPSVVWRQVGPGMSGYNEHVWVHPADPDLVFVSPDLLNAYRSTDAGSTWSTMKDCDGRGLEVTRLNDMAFAATNPDRGLAVNRQGLWETNDRGASWSTRAEWVNLVVGDIYGTTEPGDGPTSVFGGTLSAVAIDPRDERSVLVGSGDYYNQKLNRHSKSHPAGVLPDPEVFWRTNTGKIFRTDDGGRRWRLSNTGIDPRAEIGPIVYDRAHPGRVYVATSYGFYRSEDAGRTWQLRNDGLDGGFIRDLSSHYDPASGTTTLYLIDQVQWHPDGAGSVTSSGGVFRSIDGGDTWHSLNDGLRVDLNGLPRMSLNSTIRVIYYRSLGEWLELSRQQAEQDFPVLPTDILQAFDRIAVDPSDPNRIYVMSNAQHGSGFRPYDVMTTADGGQHWYVCARHGRGWAEDADYWESIGTPTTVNMEFRHNGPGSARMPYNQYGFTSLAVGPTGNVYFWHYQQTYRSTDHGDSWQSVSEEQTGIGFRSLGDANPPGRGVVCDPSDGSSYLAVGENGLWRTDPSVDPSAVVPSAELLPWPGNLAGADKAASAGRSISTMAIHPRDRDILYLITDRQDFVGQLRRSTDRGLTWEKVSQAVDVTARAVIRSLTFDAVDPDWMYFCIPDDPLNFQNRTEDGVTRGVYVSPDAGHSWQVANDGLPALASVYGVAVHPRRAGTVFAAVLETDVPGGLYRSDDHARTWTRVATPAAVTQVNDVHLHADGDGVRILLASGSRAGDAQAGGLWVSDDDGDHWENLLDLPNVYAVRSHPADRDTMAVVLNPNDAIGGINPGVYLSGDGGQRWRKINTGLGQPDRVYSVTFDPVHPRVIWCATWGSGNQVATY